MTFPKLTTDGHILFGTRVIRMFAYGFLSVVLVLYLAKLGLSEGLIGLLLSLTLIGDAAVSLWMTTTADRVGRRRVLIAAALCRRPLCRYRQGGVAAHRRNHRGNQSKRL
jgi:MFS family permease